MYQNCFTVGPFTEMKSTLCQVHRWSRPRVHGSPEAPWCPSTLDDAATTRPTGEARRCALSISVCNQPFHQFGDIARRITFGTAAPTSTIATCNRLRVSRLLHEYTLALASVANRQVIPKFAVGASFRAPFPCTCWGQVNWRQSRFRTVIRCFKIHIFRSSSRYVSHLCESVQGRAADSINCRDADFRVRNLSREAPALLSEHQIGKQSIICESRHPTRRGEGGLRIVSCLSCGEESRYGDAPYRLHSSRPPRGTTFVRASCDRGWGIIVAKRNPAPRLPVFRALGDEI